MSNLEFHVLLALAGGPLYGYAIKDAVETESSGSLAPRAGSLYRVIARLMTDGFVREAAPVGELPPHPGLARKYYALTASGRSESCTNSRAISRPATTFTSPMCGMRTSRRAAA